MSHLYVLQPIIGFRQDDAGDWVAQLACGHGQHLRHKPPFINRPWVLSARSRQAHLGRMLECLKCDRGEVPTEDVPTEKVLAGKAPGEPPLQDD